jgi:membrane protease YdiL (CAAX protease family)
MPRSFAQRIRAFGWFLIAAIYSAFAMVVSQHAARGLAPGDGYELVNRSIVLFLLLLGYASMGMVGQRQSAPLRAMGFAFRPGWLGEISLGAAIGWGGIVACVLPIAVFGEMALKVNTTPHHLFLFGLDLSVLAVAALGEEVAFRGYPFQRLIEAMGPVFATLFISLLFMVAHLQNPDSSHASLFTTLLAGWLLALAYLRTRALWVCWGFHFAWNASMGLLFGLPVSGLTIFSPVVSTYTRGPIWLTGGGYGPEGGAVAIVVLLLLLIVLIRSTRDLKHQYALPEIIPGGLAVDIDSLSRHQHELGMGPDAPAATPAGQQLVQILTPVPPLPLPPRAPLEVPIEEGPEAS